MGRMGIVGLVALAAVGLSTCVAPHLDRDTYRAKVTSTETKKSGDSDRYLVFTELEDGETRVFKNTDSKLIELKWNSSDIQGQLKKYEGTDQLVDIKTYGWRVPLFSWYENVTGVSPVTDSE